MEKKLNKNDLLRLFWLLLLFPCCFGAVSKWFQRVSVSSFSSSVQTLPFTSVSGQDEPNPVLWLATRTSKMAISHLLGITSCVLQEKFLRSRSRFTEAFFLNLRREKYFSWHLKDFLWSLYRWSWKTRKLKTSMKIKTKGTKILKSFMNLFCNKNRQAKK